MNTLATIDIEQLEMLPAQTLLRLAEKGKSAKKWFAAFQLTVQTHPDLFRKLEGLDIDPSFCMATGTIDVSFTGDGPKLAQVWAELRRHGYEPDSRPTKGDTSYNSHWRCGREGFSVIWVSFSSSVCRRVQVGTKMVEQPVYETQCEGSIDIESLPGKPELAIVPTDDLPF